MNIKQLIHDDEGVSPVIGVILMVAITVILAAVIAAFVLGLGDSDDVAPQTTFEFDLDEDPTDGDVDLTITATSGDTIDATQVSFSGEGVDSDAEDETWEDLDSPEDGTITAGTSITLSEEDDELDTDGGTVNVVWTSDDGDDSSILADFDVPDQN